MHANQITAFCATRTNHESRKMFRTPWRHEGLIYATDGSMMIRFPGGIDDIWINEPTEADHRDKAQRAREMFEAAPRGELRPLDMEFVPVIERAVMNLWDADDHDAGESDVWVARMTEVKIDGATYDARRLLLMRQTLAVPISYHAIPNRTEFESLKMEFGHRAEALLMPCRMTASSLHWNGQRYWATGL
jgi:hypothetical protein